MQNGQRPWPAAAWSGAQTISREGRRADSQNPGRMDYRFNQWAYAASTVPRRLLYRSSQRRAHGLNLAPIVASFCGDEQIEPAVVGQGAQEVAEVLQAHAAQGLGLQSEIALIARLAEAHGGCCQAWPEGTIELPMPLLITWARVLPRVMAVSSVVWWSPVSRSPLALTVRSNPAPLAMADRISSNSSIPVSTWIMPLPSISRKTSMLVSFVSLFLDADMGGYLLVFHS